MDIVALFLFFTLFQIPILLIVYILPKLWKEKAIPKPNKEICKFFDILQKNCVVQWIMFILALVTLITFLVVVTYSETKARYDGKEYDLDNIIYELAKTADKDRDHYRIDYYNKDQFGNTNYIIVEYFPFVDKYVITTYGVDTVYTDEKFDMSKYKKKD